MENELDITIALNNNVCQIFQPNKQGEIRRDTSKSNSIYSLSEDDSSKNEISVQSIFNSDLKLNEYDNDTVIKRITSLNKRMDGSIVKKLEQMFNNNIEEVKAEAEPKSPENKNKKQTFNKSYCNSDWSRISTRKSWNPTQTQKTLRKDYKFISKDKVFGKSNSKTELRKGSNIESTISSFNNKMIQISQKQGIRKRNTQVLTPSNKSSIILSSKRIDNYRHITVNNAMNKKQQSNANLGMHRMVSVKTCSHNNVNNVNYVNVNYGNICNHIASTRPRNNIDKTVSYYNNGNTPNMLRKKYIIKTEEKISKTQFLKQYTLKQSIKITPILTKNYVNNNTTSNPYINHKQISTNRVIELIKKQVTTAPAKKNLWYNKQWKYGFTSSWNPLKTAKISWNNSTMKI